MTVDSVRPSVSHLIYQLLERPVHPELLSIHLESRFEHPAFELKIQICDAGHVLTFQRQQQVLTEVAVSQETPLPQRFRLVSHRLQGHRADSRVRGPLTYHSSFQVEYLESDVYAHYHQELLGDSLKGQVSYQFPTHNRLAPAPLSFMLMESTPHMLQVHTFHTFPTDLAVVKLQSLFEF